MGFKPAEKAFHSRRAMLFIGGTPCPSSDKLIPYFWVEYSQEDPDPAPMLDFTTWDPAWCFPSGTRSTG